MEYFKKRVETTIKSDDFLSKTLLSTRSSDGRIVTMEQRSTPMFKKTEEVRRKLTDEENRVLNLKFQRERELELKRLKDKVRLHERNQNYQRIVSQDTLKKAQIQERLEQAKKKVETLQ